MDRIEQILRLAQDIRIIDHDHQTGAAELAEKLIDAGYRLQPPLDIVIHKLNKALAIIEWMSGSGYFSPEGKAYRGWKKVQADIEQLRQSLHGEQPKE